MNISIQQLLAKMEEQLKDARESQTDVKVRERVYAIKSLCELILDQDKTAADDMYIKSSPIHISHPNTIAQPQPPMNMVSQPLQTSQVQKLNTEEGNGDSLFDF
ncbi:YwdI family protein [Bacillus sp. B1-b2]|uniref:YwdI family protein n=1 Tax=Bacillus sp. B1-b2 TaxID=2653201 RepID=UPI001261E038|nr:YwdI family protein [Bacillus sp. B1-b2]KAB7670629.1 YwdI family protein [Bacillus sp. B1-b2]